MIENNANNVIFKSSERNCHQDKLIENWYYYGYYKPFREKYLKVNTEDIEYMVDEIYNDPESINDIAKRYNILFIYDEDYVGNLLISHGGYDASTDFINLYVSDDGATAFETGRKKGTMKSEILATYAHEYTHHQQNQKGSEKDNYKGYETLAKEEDSRWEVTKKYISQVQEIDAFARGFAQEMARNKVKLSYIMNNIPEVDRLHFTEEDLDKYQTAFNKKLSKYSLSLGGIVSFMYYYLIGGDVWKRYLKRLYEFLPEKLQEREYSGSYQRRREHAVKLPIHNKGKIDAMPLGWHVNCP